MCRVGGDGGVKGGGISSGECFSYLGGGGVGAGCVWAFDGGGGGGVVGGGGFDFHVDRGIGGLGWSGRVGHFGKDSLHTFVLEVEFTLGVFGGGAGVVRYEGDA